MPLTPFLALLVTAPLRFGGDTPLLMRHPTTNGSQVVFSFGGDLWSVPIAGGQAIRLTSSPGDEQDPFFSPDGQSLAFAAQYDGNADVFTIPSSGGSPKRLTFNPQPDAPLGWMPDGKRIIIGTGLGTQTPIPRMMTVGLDGRVPEPLPFPSGSMASMSPDGKRIAYVPKIHWQAAWKRYRGGQTYPIWIANLSDSSYFEIPRKNSNDFNPMWVGSKVYFLSDRTGPVTLYSFDLDSKKVTQLIKNDSFDFKSASAYGDTIVYEQLGSIGVYDIKTGQTRKLDVSIAGDFPGVRPTYKNVSGMISSARLSPSGSRVAMQARGDVFTAPASKGNVRNLTATSGAAERDPAWSPDGNWLAYFSDEDGEYRLHLRKPDGTGEVKKIELGEHPSYYYNPVWSPDSKKIAYHDKRLNLWVLDVESKKNTKIDADMYEFPGRRFDPSWSPDSKWIVYARQLVTHFRAVFLYSLDTGKTVQLTDGLSDAYAPRFDRGGKYLYFAASTNAGRSTAWLDLSSLDALNTVASIYCIVLDKDSASPFAPQSDEEKGAAEAPKEAPKAPTATKIDLDGISQRILAIPMPVRNYQTLEPGSAGSFFAVSIGAIAGPTSPPSIELTKFDMASRKPMPFAAMISGFDINASGTKMLLQQGPSMQIVDTAAPPAPGQGAVSLAEMESYVDPKAEWRQMLHEAIRIQRDFLYAPNHHGVDLNALERKYMPFVDGLVSRSDLNYLFEDMLGETCIGHTFISGGDIPSVESVPGGLLGADYSIENGRYRIARIFDGENWNPGLRAPLTPPGVSAKVGEYILAVNGRDLKGTDNIYQFFEKTAGKQVRLKLGMNPDGSGSREVVVVPIPSEGALRQRAWVEGNRRKALELSGGKIGYVYLPDTALGAWEYFNRYFYPQIDRQALIIDERYNGGGFVADHVIDALQRPLRLWFTSREGKDFPSPQGAIFGPKAMLINEYAGSGGDCLPWMFREAKLGPLIGKRTWGGLVGIYDYPELIDGGGVTAPRAAFYNLNGEWEVENWGVAPDIEVELDPVSWRAGRDPQLERAVQELMKALDKNPPKTYKKPAFPDKTKVPPGS